MKKRLSLITDKVQVTIDDVDNFGLIGHEMLHAYQYETGEVSFNDNPNQNGILNDINDETAAYNRQALIDNGARYFLDNNTQWTNERVLSNYGDQLGYNRLPTDNRNSKTYKKQLKAGIPHEHYR